MNPWTPEDEVWWLPDPRPSKLFLRLVRIAPPMLGGDQPGQIINDTGIISAKEVGALIRDWNEANVHRHLEVWFDEAGMNSAIGPIVIDVDAGEDLYIDDRIEAARAVTLGAAQWLRTKNGLAEGGDFRCIFSGAKGFHLEVRPSSVGIEARVFDCFRSRAHPLLRQLRRDLIEAGMNGGMIDPIHPYVRLALSTNEWWEDGMVRRAKTVPLTMHQLLGLSVHELVASSQSVDWG